MTWLHLLSNFMSIIHLISPLSLSHAPVSVCVFDTISISHSFRRHVFLPCLSIFIPSLHLHLSHQRDRQRDRETGESRQAASRNLPSESSLCGSAKWIMWCRGGTQRGRGIPLVTQSGGRVVMHWVALPRRPPFGPGRRFHGWFSTRHEWTWDRSAGWE